MRASAAMRHVIIVDANPADYSDVIAAGAQPGTVFRLATTGEDALRIAPSGNELWLVGVDLHDVSGIELCEELRRRRNKLVFLVCEPGRPDDERRVRERTSVPYLCKPPLAEWLAAGDRSPQTNRSLACMAGEPP